MQSLHPTSGDQLVVAAIPTMTQSTGSHRRGRPRGASIPIFLLSLGAEIGRPYFEVAVLAGSPTRLAHLLKAAQLEIPEEDQRSHLFNTFDVRDPSVFPTASWRTTDGRECELLWKDALSAAGPHGSSPGQERAE